MLNTEATNTRYIAAVDSVIARVLDISSAELHDDLGYQSIPQWDSLRHVALMLSLEEEFGMPIEQELITELRDYASIRKYFAQKLASDNESQSAHEPSNVDRPVVLHRGLSDILLDDTHVSRVDGDAGILEYRGYSIHDLVMYSSFEETAYLLLHGELPNSKQLSAFRKTLNEARSVPSFILELMAKLKECHPIEALRTGVSALDACKAHSNDQLLQNGISLIAQVPILIGAHHSARMGRAFVMPPSSLSFAEYFLRLMCGNEPSASSIRFMDSDLILHAELSANPSSLAARVAISCNAGMHSAVTAAISAFAGPLHGGAAEAALHMIDAIGSPENAESYVTNCWARNAPVMGFGHRVFRVEDPRVRHFRKAALDISLECGNMRDYKILEAVEKAMEPYARYGVRPNVDLYAGLIYRLMGLPGDLTVPIFIAGRMAGWVAQALEQHDRNILIYPLMNYVGASDQCYPKRK